MRNIIIISIVVFTFLGCASSKPVVISRAEKESGYTYIPVDPFSVRTIPGNNCKPIFASNEVEFFDILKEAVSRGDIVYNPLLESLPDNAVRMSIEKFDAFGNVTYGPAGLGSQNESYRVTVDYVNSDTTNFPVWIAKLYKNRDTGTLEPIPLLSDLEKAYPPDSVVFSVFSRPPTESERKTHVEYNIPVYVGIGLRVTANVDITGARANISGLGVIGAEAEANALKGALIVQTLGINGKSIAAALPIQSELNRTTAQNAIVSVGSIKALLYDDKTAVSPRVVGIYLPFPGGKPLVNAIISEMSKVGIQWKRPCVKIKMP